MSGVLAATASLGRAFQPLMVRGREGGCRYSVLHRVRANCKLQALVYDILPSVWRRVPESDAGGCGRTVDDVHVVDGAGYTYIIAIIVLAARRHQRFTESLFTRQPDNPAPAAQSSRLRHACRWQVRHKAHVTARRERTHVTALTTTRNRGPAFIGPCKDHNYVTAQR